MSWAARRQFKYFSAVFIVLIAALFAVIYPKLNVPPTCNDQKQNGTETGIDCGGSCALMCKNDTRDITVLWARSFEVVPGVHHALAYIENQNVDAGIWSVPYQFKIYDAENKLITSREGTTFVSPNGTMAIFEEGLDTGVNRIPKFTRFSFTEDPIFYRTPELYKDLNMVEVEKSLTDLESSPKATATFRNDSYVDVGQFEVVAIIYDAFDNAIAASKTFIDALPKQQEAQVFFSWPLPFGKEARRLEVVPLINAYKVGQE